MADGDAGNVNGKTAHRGGIKWGKYNEKEREKVLSALKARFPDRYRELVEKYYESVQKGEQ